MENRPKFPLRPTDLALHPCVHCHSDMVDCHYEEYINRFLDDITDAETIYASSVKGIQAPDVATRLARALAFLKGEDTPDWHQLSELNHDQFMSAAESAKASKAELATQRAVLTDGMSAAARAAHSTLLRDLGQQAQQEQTVKRDMDIAQAPIYLSLMPACSQIRSPEMVAAIGDKAVRTMYLILSQHAPLPAHLAPTFDASLGRMSFSGPCDPLTMHHKVFQVLSARNVLFPTTDPIAEAERNRIFCGVLTNSHNPAGKAFTDMELARSLNGSKSLRLLSALETATLIHEHLISFPAPVPSKPKGGAGIVGSPQGAPPALPGSGGLPSGRGRRGSGGQGGSRHGAPTVPVAAPIPAAAQAPAPPPRLRGRRAHHVQRETRRDAPKVCPDLILPQVRRLRPPRDPLRGSRACGHARGRLRQGKPPHPAAAPHPC